jgi:hypothetical protein
MQFHAIYILYKVSTSFTISRLFEESSNTQFEPYTEVRVNFKMKLNVIVDLHNYRTSLPQNSL